MQPGSTEAHDIAPSTDPLRQSGGRRKRRLIPTRPGAPPYLGAMANITAEPDDPIASGPRARCSIACEQLFIASTGPCNRAVVL